MTNDEMCKAIEDATKWVKTTQDLLADIREAIDGMIDVKDGEDGTPQPNIWMHLASRIDEVLPHD